MKVQLPSRNDSQIECHGNQVEVWAALPALQRTGDVEFNRSGLRTLITPHLDDGPAEFHLSAYWARRTTGKEKGDLEMIQALKSDPEMHSSLAGLLRLFDDKRFSGKSGDIVAGLIKGSNNPSLKNSLVRSMWGGELSPALQQALILVAQRMPGYLQIPTSSSNPKC